MADFETEVAKLYADLTHKVEPHWRREGPLLWSWWTTLGPYHYMPDLPQYCHTGWTARRRAKRAATTRNLNRAVRRAGMHRRDADAELRTDGPVA